MTRKRSKIRSLRGGDTRSATTKDEWLTPPEIVSALGAFDLDPCAPIARQWPTAARHFSTKDDGLAQPWKGRVWLNPPFENAGAWLDRLAAHRDGGIALVAVRTETRWFQRAAAKACAIFLFSGRIYFYHVDGRRGGPARSGHVLLAFGGAEVRAIKLAKLAGRLFLNGGRTQTK